MNIIEFESLSLLDEFKEGNEHRYGNHYQEFFIDAYTENEDENLALKFGASGNILDQTEIDNLEITLLAIDGSKEIDQALRKKLEYRLKELFNN